MNKVFLFFILVTININPQICDNSSILLNLRTGLTFSGLSSYFFSKDASSRLPSNELSHILLPSYLVGIGIETYDLINIEETYINFAIELSYGKSNTGVVTTSIGDAEFVTNTFPILFWTSLRTKGKIVPVVKFGLGAENSRFAEKYNSYPKYNFELKDWFFCWGIGGGIEFNYFENINLSLFIEWIGRENGIYKILDDGREINFDYRNGNTLLGVQFAYKL